MEDLELIVNGQHLFKLVQVTTGLMLTMRTVDGDLHGHFGSDKDGMAFYRLTQRGVKLNPHEVQRFDGLLPVAQYERSSATAAIGLRTSCDTVWATGTTVQGGPLSPRYNTIPAGQGTVYITPSMALPMPPGSIGIGFEGQTGFGIVFAPLVSSSSSGS